MITICAYCGKVKVAGEYVDPSSKPWEPVYHDVCPDCMVREMTDQDSITNPYSYDLPH
jgi:hypothetical protein